MIKCDMICTWDVSVINGAPHKFGTISKLPDDFTKLSIFHIKAVSSPSGQGLRCDQGCKEKDISRKL